MRRVWIILLASLLLTLAVIPALAQEDEGEWICHFDFTTGDHGWMASELFGSSIRASDGWHDSLRPPGYRGVDIEKTFSTGTLTRLEVDFTRIEGLDAGFTSDAHQLAVPTLIYLQDYRVDPDEPLILEGDWSLGRVYIKFFSGITTGDPGGSVVIHSVTLSGPGDGPAGEECDEEEPPEEETELTRPLAANDRLFAIQSIETGTISGTDTLAKDAVIFGAKKDAQVSAVIDGTVTQIEPLTPALCATLFEPATAASISDASAAYDGCRVTLVAAFPGSGDYVQLFSPINNPEPAFVIHIAGSDGREYLQIATDVDQYVYEGQPVSAGCWLGRALSLPANPGGTVGTIVGIYSPVVGAFLQVFGQNQQPFEALTAAWVLSGSTYVNAWDEYILEPSDSAPCNTPEGYEGCMGDSRLEDASSWQSSNNVSWTDPGALLATGGYISATFNLDLDREPIAIIGAVAVPLGNLSLKFGTNSDPVAGVLGTTEVEIAAGDPDQGEFFTLRIENTGDTPIRLAFVCVIHENDPSGGPAPRPPATGTTICYFIDSSFEAGLDNWTGSEDVQENDGSLLLPDEATIEQDIALKAGTYTLKVVSEVWATGAYTPDETDTTGGITLEYAYPGATFVSLGSKSWATYTHKTQVFTGSVVLADDEEGTFTLSAAIASAPTGALGVQINSACLTKDGQDIPGSGEGDGIFTPTCGAIATPPLSATAPGTWSTWLWAQLNKFYRCELMKVLNSMYTAMQQFFRTALWAIRWNQAAAMRYGAFTGSAFYWLNGHLHNIAVGRIYVVEGGTGYDSAGDIGDVILGGLKSVIDVFIGLLQRIIDFVFYILQLVFQLALAIVVALIQLAVVLIGLIIGALGQFFDVIHALFFAWNNSPAVPIAGMPQCALEPKESPVCIFLWTLENTIFSGRGFLFIPFFVAYGSAELLLWTIAKLSKRAQETGQSG